MSTENLEKLLSKYKNGKCTEEEISLLQDLILAESDKHAFPDLDDAKISDRANLIKNNIDSEIHRIEYHDSKRNSFALLLQRPSRVAASIILAFVLSFVVYHNWEFLYNSTVPVTTKTYTTEVGKQLKIALPDGSEVWLNSSSTLSYTNRFNQKTREVVLSGEAFFKVEKDIKSFIVHSGNLDTKVLGTSFNVQAYSSSKTIDVALLTGKVWVDHKDENAVLKPGQFISLNKSNEKLGVVQNRRVTEMLSWKEGRLIFKNTPVTEVFQRLQGIYDLSFEIRGNALKPLTIYGTFDMNDQPRPLVEALCKILNAEFKFTSPKHVIIYQANN